MSVGSVICRTKPPSKPVTATSLPGRSPMDLTFATAPAASIAVAGDDRGGAVLVVEQPADFRALWIDSVVRTLTIERAAALMPWRARPLR